MKKYILLAIIILGVKHIFSQNNHFVDSLKYILFEDLPVNKIRYSFHCKFENETYTREVRYNDLKGERVERICKKIRVSKDYTLISDLQKILKKQEKYFLEEWEIAWKDGGGPNNIFDDQSNILVSIDMTISCLIMEKENWTPKQKYEYLKNLYLLIHGDYDLTRIDNTLFKSTYIKDVKKGYNSSSLFLPSTNKYTLIDEFFDEFVEVILDDIANADVQQMSDGDKKFYGIALRKFFVMNKDKRIDSLLINRSLFFDAMDYLKLEENEPLLSVKYFHVLLDRYKLNSQNSKLLEPIINDLCSKKNIFSAKKIYFDLFIAKSESMGSRLLSKRFITDINSIKNNKEVQEYMKRLVEVLDTKSQEEVLNELKSLNPSKAKMFNGLISEINEK